MRSFFGDLLMLCANARTAKDSPYKDGYVTALEDVLELWEEHDE